nr:MAG TPA: tail protein [Caudoviricetes sp.]
MGIISSGQITITDLSDAPVLSAFITASQTTTQVFDQTANTYNPSYTSTPQTLTLNLTKAGQTTSILGQVGKVNWYEYNGSTKTAITSTTNTDNQYLSGTNNEVLTTKVNVPASAGAKRYEAVGTWTDPITGLKVDFRASIDLLVVQLGKQALILNVYTGKGNTFYNNQPGNLTVNADLYKGNSLSGGNKQFKFFYADSSVTGTSSAGYDSDGGIGWHLCSSTTTGQTPNVAPGTNTTAQGVLTVTPDVVVNSQTYKVVCIDKTGGTDGQQAVGVATILDFSDPVVVVVESSAGDTFKNSIGSTTLKARLYRKGEELDANGTNTNYTYKWSRRDKNGTLDANFGGTGNQYKTGKSIAVSASDVSDKAVFTCEVFEN